MKTTDTYSFKNLKRAGLVLRPEGKLDATYKELKRVLKKHNISLHVEKKSAKLLNIKGVKFETLCKECDFLISLGGDGTLLYTCRSAYEYELPVLGIYAGNLGFLTLIKQDEIEWFFSQMENANCEIQSRMMLGVNFIKNNKCVKKDIAFNDVVFEKGKNTSMIKIDAYINNQFFNSYIGDGVIASTPTGSTAYNLSAGGAIIYPLVYALILTSICPHSLTQRPLVLPMDFDVKFKSKNCTVAIDGQNHYELSEFDCIKIEMAKKIAKLIGHESRDYFDILREKLSWGNV